jgi:hypothetical protein
MRVIERVEAVQYEPGDVRAEPAPCLVVEWCVLSGVDPAQCSFGGG